MKISPKKLIKMVRKWQKVAALSRRRISFPRISNASDNHVDASETCAKLLSPSSSSVTAKGHFVVYTTDERRFVMPLAYLKHNILRELLRMSEEEYGLSTDSPIRLPCNAVFMEYVVSVVQRGGPNDLEKALLRSMESTCGCSILVSSPSQYQELASQQFLVCS